MSEYTISMLKCMHVFSYTSCLAILANSGIVVCPSGFLHKLPSEKMAVFDKLS